MLLLQLIKNCRARGAMKKYWILIADRNPRVRAFLRRELRAEGYRVTVAGSRAEVVRAVFGDNRIDVIILDPNLPDDDPAALFSTLRSRIPAIPVIIHTFVQDGQNAAPPAANEIFVEKQANSIETLKKIIRDITCKNP